MDFLTVLRALFLLAGRASQTRSAAMRGSGLLAVFLVGGIPAAAQFSPGELSRPHAHLEGTTNCASCHDVGRELSGKKCLVCHAEIAVALQRGNGLHGLSAKKSTCIACHKEHLGLEAHPTVFRKETFDHAATGFLLAGRHTTARCEACHTARNIRDPQVAKIVRTTGRKSYLGLEPACSSCHADRHAGAVGTSCQSCHDASGWSPARGFNHANAAFRLDGEHARVSCTGCHAGMRSDSGKVVFTSKAFSDCTPCHASPHNEKFTRAACSSCHSPDGWRKINDARFNHELTGFRLAGKHAAVRCEQCHRSGGAGEAASPRKRLSTRCAGCHADPHRGEFAARYANDCARCHTEQGFVPARFTLGDHEQSRFGLTGAHRAIPCARCHLDAGGTRVFRFAALSCDDCHRDPHGGQFMTTGGKKRACEECHGTSDWKQASFDHAATGFPLVAKHAAVACERCHAVGVEGRGVARFRGTSRDCQSCHRDAHAGQFAENGATPCAACHSPAGWRNLVFNHTTQTGFPLTGGHAQVACRSCHKKEEMPGGETVRYRPLATRCESCHTQKRIPNG